MRCVHLVLKVNNYISQLHGVYLLILMTFSISTMSLLRRSVFVSFTFLLISCAVFSQAGQSSPKKNKYTLSGYVKEDGSSELLVGAHIYIPKLETGTSSNTYGFFSITLPEDSFEVIVSFVGYQPKAYKINLNQDVQLDVAVKSSIELGTIEVVASKKGKISESSRMSVIEIPVQQIKDIPALLGEKDVLKVVQLMPGVQSGSEGNSGLYVRGGGPDQNLIILDDAIVYNAYHLFGFFSLFNGDALKSVELTKGGFPARYGGRLSSVLDMNMKEGNKEEFKGEAGIGLISSKLTLEGPLKKNKSSFLVSGRRTYLDYLTRPFMPAGETFGYMFYDVNTKVNYDFGPKNKVYLSGYFGRDRFKATFSNNQEQFRFFWGNATGTARWNHLFNNKLFSNTSLVFSNYRLVIEEKSNFSDESFLLRYSSGIRDYGAKIDFDYRPSPVHTIRTGFASTFHQFEPSALVVEDESIDDFRTEVSTIEALESGIYIEDDIRANSRLKFNIGLRTSHFYNNNKHYLNPEPRISVRYMLRENLAAKASYANMNQYVHLLSQTGLGLPTDLWVPSTDRVAPQKTRQIAAGLAKDLPKNDLMVSLEGYYKKSEDIISFKEGASFLLIDDAGSAEDINWESAITAGEGWSYGVEFFVQKKVGRFTGWVGYTLSYTQLQFDSLNFGEKFFARYDRRHDVSIVTIFKLKENVEEQKKITLSMNWVYGTGNSITLPLAEYRVVSHQNGNSSGNFFNTINHYGERNGFRMAPYHRMDIGVQFHKKIKKGDRTFELSFYNFYNRANPFFYYVDRNRAGDNVLKQVSLFPFIPAISYNVKF